ncbi:MAG: hypothetical protein SF097_19740 [Acidobacteriota bacterium]|nr:hypothetical protein [Acidobacteriota bacterium]
MKRTLSAFDLTALGIGAIVGAGIFSLVGTAFAGETFSSKIKTPLMNFIIAGLTGSDVQLGRPAAGPALVISLILAAVACAFAAFCDAEVVSMILRSGSAYIYSYATLENLRLDHRLGLIFWNMPSAIWPLLTVGRAISSSCLIHIGAQSRTVSVRQVGNAK